MMNVLKDWAMGLIGLVLFLTGIVVLAYTKYVGMAIILLAVGVLFAAFNVMAALDTYRGRECDDFH